MKLRKPTPYRTIEILPLGTLFAASAALTEEA